MKENKTGNILQALIKCILRIFIEKSIKISIFYPLKKDSGIGGDNFVEGTKKLGNLYILETITINGKNILTLEFFLTVI